MVPQRFRRVVAGRGTLSSHLAESSVTGEAPAALLLTMDTIDTEQTYGRMLRLARRMVTDDADDTAHDAWLLTQTRTDAEPADAYLRTAIRWARDMRWRTDARRKQRELHVAPSDSDEARVELILAIVEALDTLSPVDRDLVWRRHVDGHTPDEIAEVSGLRADAVRQRVLRALRSLRQKLDRDYGDRKSWAAIALTLDGASTPVVPAAAKASTFVAPTGVLFGTVGGLMIAWGMSCTGPHDRAPTNVAGVIDLEPIAVAAPIPPTNPVSAAQTQTPRAAEPNARKTVPADRSKLLAGTFAKRFDADSYRRFRKEVNDSFVECVREWNEASGDTARKMEGKTVFIVELDVIANERVDVDEVWTDEDTATMRDLVACMQHGLETVTVEPIVGTLPEQMRVVLDGPGHKAIAVPVIDLEGLPEDLRDDHERLDALGGWMMGKDVPAGAEAAVARFAEAFSDGRIAPGELDDATLETLRGAS